MSLVLKLKSWAKFTLLEDMVQSVLFIIRTALLSILMYKGT